MSTTLCLDFTTNWNGKLFMDNFSTVRLLNHGKYFVGNEMEIKLRGVSFGYAKVIAVRPFRYKQISDVLSYIDIGKPAHYLGSLIEKFYSKKVDLNRETELHHIVLHYTQRNIENQRAAIQDWWEGIVNKTQTAA